MPASSLTLATFTVRVLDYLMDSANAVFSVATVTEAIRLTVQEYSFAKPRSIIDASLTPANGAREISLATLTNIIDVFDLWYPYDSVNPDPMPIRPEYTMLDNDGVWSIYLNDTEGDGASKIRIFYHAAHTLDDLDSATATTFPKHVEPLMVMGAAGHCLLARAVDLAETTGVSAVSTPNYAALGVRYLKKFRAHMGMPAIEGGPL
jgi:hypothetical protein